ncbi:hypothetical protein L2K70_12885 [Nocardioides KLBMP 9356]|uniref:Uncharacterized protein n=1 Tax=Nocardioides potassii TaxID=2911371 RepID=A0ABS9HE58_9ACTN|nr:hypothetical protein [Nocardioides potassii]MCF6378500.1 hypothetical protein [Nocardioides potassii]
MPAPDTAPALNPPPRRRNEYVLGVHVGDFLVVGAGAWAIIGSVQDYYTVSLAGTGTDAFDAWHGLLSSLGVVLAVAGSLVLVMSLAGVARTPLRSVVLVLYLTAAAATLASYVVTPSGLCDDLVWLDTGCAGAEVHRGDGFWRTLMGTGGGAFVFAYWSIVHRLRRRAA